MPEWICLLDIIQLEQILRRRRLRDHAVTSPWWLNVHGCSSSSLINHTSSTCLSTNLSIDFHVPHSMLIRTVPLHSHVVTVRDGYLCLNYAHTTSPSSFRLDIVIAVRWGCFLSWLRQVVVGVDLGMGVLEEMRVWNLDSRVLRSYLHLEVFEYLLQVLFIWECLWFKLRRGSFVYSVSCILWSCTRKVLQCA